ncbi:phage tail protein [Alteromonas sp. a30]|uniref:phage tail protein n=1 Tax=Alteromonas sp. a30 TaxID=2730917 RepID=UPI00227ED58D|nr:phage tail protein [Alteromonas sp. a30]MCY7295090.1 phage tail protein [Alteromonas sp. a30]
MANSVMLRIGEYEFSLETAAFQQFQQSVGFDWAEQQRIGNHSALQYLGQGKKEIALPGVIYPEYRGGYDQIRKMEAEAGKGKPLQLHTGSGSILGLWIITSVSETSSIFYKNGVPRKIEFSLKLTYFGPSQQDKLVSFSSRIRATAQQTRSTDVANVVKRLEFPPAQLESAFRSLNINLRQENGTLKDIDNIIDAIQWIAKDFDASSQLLLMRELLGDEVANRAAAHPTDLFQGAKNFFNLAQGLDSAVQGGFF